MNHLIDRTLLFACCACLSIPASAGEFQRLKDGVALGLGGNQVELRVATQHAFELHVSSPGEQDRTRSIFLSGEAQSAPAFNITHNGLIVGIKTEFGELQADTGTQKWSLRDNTGSALADWASLPKATGTNTSDQGLSFNLAAGPSSNRPHPLYYGSGNGPDFGALAQTEASSRAGNGSTSLPQYWSNAGYGALLVTARDNKPATWKANAAGGVDWTIPGPSADLYLAPAANLYDWLRDDAELTGFPPVPPRWSLGYMQSRWGWKDKAYIEDTLAHFRKDSLPVDAFIIDFEWYTQKPDYEVKTEGDPDFADYNWNSALFPAPLSQIADYARQGIHIIGIRKPRLGNRDNLAMARGKGWILPPNPDDPNSAGIRTRNLDFSRPEVRAWWEENNRKFVEAGMAGFWNDEGETSYTEYSYWNLAENDLFKQVDPDARFFSLNRSFPPGLQRFGAAAWTGDINSEWEALAKTPGQLLSYSLSGMPYSACDIGGFYGDPGAEKLARWMEAGVFFPVQRSHSVNSSTPHFPWVYGPEAENAIREALDLRYRLIPYYYSLAVQNDQTAAPLMRPLVMEFPGDDRVASLTDEWLMGKGLLAAPILRQGGVRDIYLPDDQWFAFGENQMTKGPQTVHVTAKLDQIPLYVRAGTLLPLGPVLQYTGQATSAPLELQIYPGHDGSFDFVEDDGKTLEYRKGNARLTAFSWDDQTKTLSWKISGNYSGANCFREMNAVLFSPQGPVIKKTALDQGNSITFN